MNEGLNVTVNKQKGNALIIAILSIILIGLASYICYEKFIKKNDSKECTCEKNECNCEKCDTSAKETCDCTKENIQENDNTNSVKTRICTGTYTGTGAIGKDVVTKELTNGTIKVTLKSDGTYTFAKDGTEWASGNYTIIENALLLKTTDDICGPGMDCSATYSNLLFIENDCSQINGGYGSFLFDPNFTLKK